MISPQNVHFTTSSHAHFTLLSAIFLFIVQRIYHWTNQTSNWMIFGFYLFVILVEIFILGLPRGIPINGANPKGILLQIFIALAPLSYLIARFLTVLPILDVILKRRKFWDNELV